MKIDIYVNRQYVQVTTATPLSTNGEEHRRCLEVTMSAALANRLERIRELGGIKGREIAQLMGTTPETVSRWNTGKIEPQPGRLEKLLMLEWMIDELSEFFAPDEARLWLFSPNRMLGGSRPVDHIQKGQIDEVRALIAQLRDGAYV